MRIAYLAIGIVIGERLGVAGKIADQTRAWERAGHDVHVFVQGPRRSAEARIAGMGLDGRIDVMVDPEIRSRLPFSALRRRFRAIAAFAERVRRWRPDLLYVRYNIYYPALTTLAARTPMVLEVNTDDVKEYRRVLSHTRYLYHRVTRGRLLRQAIGLVFVTGELARCASFAQCDQPRIVLANGIDLSSYTVPPARSGGRPRVVFIGSPGHPWHGVDKLLTLARALPDCDFDLIGPSDVDLEAVPENVALHGYLPRERYEPILARADVAVGTLALHRKGMEEAAPLKVREYLACGLPTVIGYRDTDFPDGSEFLLQLPNTPDNIESGVARIRDFIERMRGRRVPREAVTHLDHANKEEQRLAFFEALLGGGPMATTAGARPFPTTDGGGG